MAIKSISDLYNYSLFIFDLDNTIYNEEDYLFQAYEAVASRFSDMAAGHDKKSLYETLKQLYYKEGREKLFDKFLASAGIDYSFMPECLNILRNFKPEKPLIIYNNAAEVLKNLSEKKKNIFILTNGNTDQQRNKIRNILWNGLDKHIRFIYADDIEPKPSPAGVHYILRITNTEPGNALFVGDKDTDRQCAESGGIAYLDVSGLDLLLKKVE